MKKINKTTLAVLIGAVTTIAASFFPAIEQEVWGSLQTVLVAAGVWAIPNMSS